MADLFDPICIAQDLIRCPSVTPEEGGALDYLQALLSDHGFVCRRLPFSQAGTPDVDNLYARFGTGAPHLCFAGHTDVVPTGDETLWTHPPFAGEIADGVLFGRGAADMKGGIACFVAAALNVLKSEEQSFKGSISFLITGDEEGPAINGTKKMLEWLDAQGEVIDHCLVGEPTNPSELGEEAKVGRRGSLNGVLTIRGTQGHVAYPHLAHNPVDGGLAVLSAFLAEPLDDGTEFFSPSNLEITSVDVGNEAENVIPEKITAMFNIRFNNRHTAESLMEHLRGEAGRALEHYELRHSFKFRTSAESFIVEPGVLSEVLSGAIEAICGRKPALTTTGGTSDARFIKDYCPVIEFGLSNKTIHQIDEQVDVDDLVTLTAVYERFIVDYFASV